MSLAEGSVEEVVYKENLMARPHKEAKSRTRRARIITATQTGG